MLGMPGGAMAQKRSSARAPPNLTVAAAASARATSPRTPVSPKCLPPQDALTAHIMTIASGSGAVRGGGVSLREAELWAGVSDAVDPGE